MGSTRRTAIGALVASAMAIGTITQWEGFRSEAYVDMAGVPTIGYGSTKDVKIGDRIDEKGARMRLIFEARDIYGVALNNCVKVPLNQSEYDAYISLMYNIGSTAFCRSTLVKKLNQGDYTGACEQIKRWNKVKGKEIQGLTNRREAEYKLCIQ